MFQLMEHTGVHYGAMYTKRYAIGVYVEPQNRDVGWEALHQGMGTLCVAHCDQHSLASAQGML